MITNIRRLLRTRAGPRPPIFTLAFVVLFWTIFDSAMTYVTPLLIEQHGFSNTMTGVIIGTSSITGALFDFLISKMFRNLYFRRVFLVMFALCFVYPLLLWQAKTLWFFLFVMAVWGIYYDLHGFGIFNFIGRFVDKKDHSSSFGLIQIFGSLGAILGPLIIGLVIVTGVDWRSFALGWIFLGIGFIFFVVLMIQMRKYPMADKNVLHRPRRKNFFLELHLWKKLGKTMIPVLILTFYLFFIEAFFWTLGPLYAEADGLKQFGGVFLTAYALPALIVGWFIGPLTRRFGKKHTAYVSLFLGSVILSSFFYLPGPIVAIAVVFIASCFISMALPAINAAYADYISELPQVDGEIEGLEDFSLNVGYIIGPISAGVLADVLSIPATFGILGITGAVMAVILYVVTPKHIKIRILESEL